MEKQLRKKKAIVRQNRTFRLSEYESEAVRGCRGGRNE